MKITVYSTKGWCWKTPIATNLILDKSFALATNERFHSFDGFIPTDRLLSIDINDSFPNIPSSIDIVFDLAGAISDSALSIISALEQSDLVLVPINNEFKSIKAGLNTIAEAMNFNKNIVVIAAKLKRRGVNDKFDSWTDSYDFENISNQVKSKFVEDIQMLPLKLSDVFDLIFEKEQSIAQLMESWPLYRHTFKEVSEQFDAIYKLIDQYDAK